MTGVWPQVANNTSMSSRAWIKWGAGVVALLFVISTLVPERSLASSRAIDLRVGGEASMLRGAGKAAAVGDVNGDGVGDLAVSNGGFIREPENGIVYVVFGSSRLDDMDLAELGNGGFVIHGREPESHASYVDGAGDVNGDGLDDIIVGAPRDLYLSVGVNQVDGNFRTGGAAYVVFGKRTTDPVYLDDFDKNRQGTQGFRIMGPRHHALAGRQVTGLGDMNHDGLDDVAVAAPFAGSTYVVFGKKDPLPVDLLLFHYGAQGPLGWRIDTRISDPDSFYSIDGAGDVNGDGTPDVIVGVVPNAKSPGSAFIVYGKSDSTTVYTRNLADDGFRVRGEPLACNKSHIECSGQETGRVVAGAGDVNGDGFADVAVAAPRLYALDTRGNIYVIFGRRKAEDIYLPVIARRGYIIDSEHGVAHDVGDAIASAGDLDHDGRDDLLIGAPYASPYRRPGAGAVYVIYGRSRPGTVRLHDLGPERGFVIHGARSPDLLGHTVASPGDLDRDGIPEILAGAYCRGCVLHEDDRPREDLGAAFLIWSSGFEA